jgi:hypothetical protein
LTEMGADEGGASALGSWVSGACPRRPTTEVAQHRVSRRRQRVSLTGPGSRLWDARGVEELAASTSSTADSVERLGRCRWRGALGEAPVGWGDSGDRSGHVTAERVRVGRRRVGSGALDQVKSPNFYRLPWLTDVIAVTSAAYHRPIEVKVISVGLL